MAIHAFDVRLDRERLAARLAAELAARLGVDAGARGDAVVVAAAPEQVSRALAELGPLGGGAAVVADGPQRTRVAVPEVLTGALADHLAQRIVATKLPVEVTARDDHLTVTSRSIDVLREVIAMLEAHDLPVRVTDERAAT